MAVKSVVAIRASTTHTTVTRATALSGGFRGGARVACPPPYFSTKMRPEGPKKIFLETAPPLSQGLDDRPPPLSESLDPSLTTPTASTTATTLTTLPTPTTDTTLTKRYYTYYSYYTY